MVWDLRGAMLKKQEVETARLLDFQFRHRARTMRLLADVLAIDGDGLVRRIVQQSDAEILDDLAGRVALTRDELDERFHDCASDARIQLIAERGDPRPHRLA